MRISDWSSDVCSSDLASGASVTCQELGMMPGASRLQDLRVEHEIGRGKAAKRDRRGHDRDLPFEAPCLTVAIMAAQRVGMQAAIVMLAHDRCSAIALCRS